MPQAVSAVLDHLSSLPPFPKVAAKLMTLFDDPSIGASELSEVLSMDPALVMKVIHASNSPFYMLSKPVESVNQAVLVLGMKTIKTITTASAIIQGVSQIKPRPDVFDINKFWKHSYATAIAATKISILENNPNGNRLYLVGLIHDIGKLVIAYYWPESWKRIVTHLKTENKTYDEVESELFMCTNTEVTLTLCRNWKFPDYTIELIKQKLLPDGPQPEYAGEYNILRKANILAGLSGYPFPVENKISESNYDLSSYASISKNLSKDVEHQLKSLI